MCDSEDVAPGCSVPKAETAFTGWTLQHVLVSGALRPRSLELTHTDSNLCRQSSDPNTSLAAPCIKDKRRTVSGSNYLEAGKPIGGPGPRQNVVHGHPKGPHVGLLAAVVVGEELGGPVAPGSALQRAKQLIRAASGDGGSLSEHP
jgi:hypothetical protein